MGLNKGEKMKKIAIVTLTGYFNYGNRLQNYALQEILKSLGFFAETLIIKPRPKETIPIKTRLINLLKSRPDEIINRMIYKLFIKKREDKINEIRTRKFKRFTYRYIHEADYDLFEDSNPKYLSENYDYFIAGSDQVWNPAYTKGHSIYFLTFAEMNKRIAYAPSFGVSEIGPKYLEEYKKLISDITYLSVREDDGAAIIKKLTRRDVPVVLDPTLLLTKKQWLKIAKKSKYKPKGKYLVTYFLGGIPDCYKKQIKSLAKMKKLKIVNLGDIKDPYGYIADPGEFIDYIKDCSAVLTDSYHGTIFSIIFGKPFVVFERTGTLQMVSRIDTLLKKFKLTKRKIENLSLKKDLFNIDFSHVSHILEAEREKSMDYLKFALAYQG